MHLRRYRSIALLLLGLQLSSCASWQPSLTSPPRLIQEEEPSVIRVTRLDGERVTIRNPVISADSVTGEGGSVAVSDIQQLESRRFSAGRTVVAVVLIGGAVVVTGFFAWLISCGDSHRSGCPS